MPFVRSMLLESKKALLSLWNTRFLEKSRLSLWKASGVEERKGFKKIKHYVSKA